MNVIHGRFIAAHTQTQTDFEEIRELFDSLDNLFDAKLQCHPSMKHMTVPRGWKGCSDAVTVPESRNS